jgi:LysM repeat protein
LGGPNQTARLYKCMKRSHLRLFLPFGMLLLALFGNSLRSSAQAGDPYYLVAAVNSLRAGNGLPALEADGTLMSIAQGHSDYQASIGQVTHTGAGGTRPKDRAVAAGYGGGRTFYISENIAGGNNLSVDGVISMWLGDAPHIQTMLGANYQDIGAGVSVSDGFVYYTIDVGYVAGGGSNSPPSANTPVVNTPGGPTAIPVYLVQTATSKPDGSIVHVVRSGQTLIGIAIAYGVTVNEIKELNYLTSDVIYEGDKLTIRTAGTPGPTATVTATATPTRAASPTRNPTRTPTRSPIPEATSSITPADPVEKTASQVGSDQLGSILVIAIIILAVGGVILMVVGSFMKQKPKG